MGSSPLTRGKLPPTGSRTSPMGLIPAHAGKTTRRSALQSVAGAHPRSRGENAPRMSTQILPSGSSPLTRGKPGTHARCGRDRRLIPAHAGKTSTTPEANSRSRAHPRSRGENSSMTAARSSRMGSSPLTRGKLVETESRRSAAGLIPAHAGKTAGHGQASFAAGAHPRSRGENE